MSTRIFGSDCKSNLAGEKTTMREDFRQFPGYGIEKPQTASRQVLTGMGESKRTREVEDELAAANFVQGILDAKDCTVGKEKIQSDSVASEKVVKVK
jgi:hypothetical protein